jgi:uncharacterized protein YcbK (DUF882 family)
MLTWKKNSLFLLLAAAAAVSLLLPAPQSLTAQSRAATQALPSAESPAPADARLVLFNTHTHERLDIVYRRAGHYLPDALAELDYFLRDHSTGAVRHLNPRLYDILSALTVSIGRPAAEISIVCGYRTPSTNEALRERTTGVAKNSLHIQAEAIDLRIPGVATLTLRRAALALHQGGVGYYPRSDFIHVDVGPVRQWCFDCSAGLKAGD